MILTVDNREPHLFDRLTTLLSPESGGVDASPPPLRCRFQPLTLGDMTLAVSENEPPWIIFERKSLADLVASIKDGRYEEQSHRLLHSSGVPPHNIVYIIEGMYSQLRHEKERKMCLSALTSLFFYKGFTVLRTCSVHETAELVWSISMKIIRESVQGTRLPAYLPRIAGATPPGPEAPSEDPAPAVAPAVAPYCEVVHKVKKENITPDNIGTLLLCTLPGVSSTIATEIMRHYSSFAHFLTEIQRQPEQLDEIRLGVPGGKTRKLGKNVVDTIRRYLLPKSVDPI